MMRIRLDKTAEAREILGEIERKHMGRQRRFPIYWSFRAKGASDVIQTEYHFVIPNTDKREIEDIKGIIRGLISFGSIELLKEMDGKTKKNNVYWKYLHFETNNQKISIPALGKAYNGKTEKDNRLYERYKLGYEAVEEYIQNKLEDIVSK